MNSINQGSQFKKYQTKITNDVRKSKRVKQSKTWFVEGFSNFNSSMMTNTNTNTDVITEIQTMQTTYNNLLQQYADAYKSFTNTSLATIQRENISTNPYLNKTIQFNTGQICYVTAKGVVKYIPSQDIFNSVNIPKNIIQIDLPWLNDYAIVGTIIQMPSPATFNLITGTPVTLNETLGNEGSNVYVSKLLNNFNSNYVGCYNMEKSSTSTNSLSIGYTTYEKCKEYATDNGYQYYGLHDYKTDGTANCNVSKELTELTKNGDGTNLITFETIWASNTETNGGIQAILNIRGRLTITNGLTDVWQSTETDAPDCIVQYSLTNQTDALGNDLSHFENTNLGKCQSKCNDNVSCYGISINNATNECWLKSQFQTITTNNDTSLYQKQTQTNNCKVMLVLQDDGNMCIYQGTPDNIKQPPVWCTMTNGKQQVSNNDWIASKSTFGRNYIVGGEMLTAGQWIGSNNGKIKLIMETNGNLVLYTSTTKVGCNRQNGQMYGTQTTNSVYQLNNVGDNNVLGKIAYIDADSQLKEYPTSMLEYTQDYQIYPNMTSDGNEYMSMVTENGETHCKSNCNDDPKCVAYTYMPSSKTCWLKSSKGQQGFDADRTLGVKMPKITSKLNSSCSDKINVVDSLQYANYSKGKPMNAETTCSKIIDQSKLDNIKDKLTILGQDISTKMETLYNQDKQIYKRFNTNAQQFQNDLVDYKNVNAKIS